MLKVQICELYSVYFGIIETERMLTRYDTSETVENFNMHY